MGTGPAASRNVTDRGESFAHIEARSILGPRPDGNKRAMLSPLAAPLSLEPDGHGIPVIPSVSPELQARHTARTGLLPHPRLGNREAFGYFSCSEKTFAQVARLTVTSISATRWAQRPTAGQSQRQCSFSYPRARRPLRPGTSPGSRLRRPARRSAGPRSGIGEPCALRSPSCHAFREPQAQVTGATSLEHVAAVAQQVDCCSSLVLGDLAPRGREAALKTHRNPIGMRPSASHEQEEPAPGLHNQWRHVAGEWIRWRRFQHEQALLGCEPVAPTPELRARDLAVSAL